MKKKFFVAALAATMFATTAMGLAACSKDGALGELTPGGGGGGGGGDKVYTVTLNANGGSFAGGETTKQIQTNANATVEYMPAAPTTAPTVNHTFRGWGVTSTASNTLDFPYTVSGNNKVIYALWTDNGGGGGGGGEEDTGVFTITFHAEGGTFTEDSEPVTRQTSKGKISSAQLPDIERTDYTFLGWYTTPTTGGKLATAETFTANGDVYARWKEKVVVEQPDHLIPGDYYLVGAGFSTDYCETAGYIGSTSGSMTLTLAVGASFKIAQCEDDSGTINWTDSYGFSAVTAGKGYVKASEFGDAVIKVAGTYTIRFDGSSIEITSSDVPEPQPSPGPTNTYEAVKSTGFYLVGAFDGGSFEWNSGYVMEAQGGVYVVNGFNVEAGAGVKIRNGGNEYGHSNVVGGTDLVVAGGGYGTDIEFIEGGTYNISITSDGKITVSKA